MNEPEDDFSFDDFLGAIDEGVARRKIKIQFWMCPREDHGGKTDANGWPIPSVEWIGGVAHCLEPDCGRKSTDTKEGAE